MKEIIIIISLDIIVNLDIIIIDLEDIVIDFEDIIIDLDIITIKLAKKKANQMMVILLYT